MGSTQRLISARERDLGIEKNEERAERPKDDLSVEGPFGWRVRANGREVIVFLVFAIAMGSVLWAIRDHDLRSIEILNQATLEQTRQIDRVAAAQLEFQESLSTMIYVLSLSSEDRAKLKLEMPANLRARLLTSERNR